MKNVTISMDDQVARWVRIRAAEGEMSLSRYIGELLRAQMAQNNHYNESMQRALARGPVTLKSPAAKYPNRESLYERPVFRR